jgi:hypothetical protein
VPSDQHPHDHLAGQVDQDGAPPGGADAGGRHGGDLLQGGDRLLAPAAAHLDHQHP